MKLRKALLSFACAIMVALSFTACGDDWADQDDPAGGQIYPSKTTVATYDFEYSEEKPEYSDMISHDESCEVTNDETLAKLRYCTSMVRVVPRLPILSMV